jgi:hypothetical protein
MKIEVRNGLEVRIVLAGGMFTRRRFYKRGHIYGVTHSFNGAKEKFRGKEDAQKALDELLQKPNVAVYDVKGKQLWPITKEGQDETT